MEKGWLPGAGATFKGHWSWSAWTARWRGVGVTFKARVSGMGGVVPEEFCAGAKHMVLGTLMESEKNGPS